MQSEKITWPKEKTAFLIIHGVGEQNPFETLDSFVRTFLKVLKENNPDKEITIEHCIRPRTVDSRVEWVENYISLYWEWEEMYTHIYENFLADNLME